MAAEESGYDVCYCRNRGNESVVRVEVEGDPFGTPIMRDVHSRLGAIVDKRRHQNSPFTQNLPNFYFFFLEAQ